MATSAKPYDDRPPVRVGPAPATSSGGADVLKEIWKTVKFVLAPVASLKLTVALFVASIFLVLVGTLAQDKQDMWEVIEDYFRPTLWPPKFGFAWIDAQVFFPEAWFPNMTETAASFYCAGAVFIIAAGIAAACYSSVQSERMRLLITAPTVVLGLIIAVMLMVMHGFIFPGGYIIGALLFLNLAAAHLVRFTMQGRGLQLLLGAAVVLVGVLVTVLVILSGHNPSGLQGEPPISWPVLWLAFKVGLFGIWGATIVPAAISGIKFFSAEEFDKKNLIYSIIFGSFAIILTIVVAFLWLISPGFQLDDSSMRILWQLLQGLVAAMILLGGCMLVFRKRAGIVVLHLGVGLLIFNELLVGYHAVEERMQIKEGETVNFVKDLRAVELAVVDSSGADKNRVVAVPMAVNGKLTSYAKDEVIQHSELPFDIHLVEYYKNSDLVPAKPGEKNIATDGWGKQYVVKEQRQASGAAGDSQVDVASAYVKLTRKDGSKNIGTYLVSQNISELEMPEKVEADGKTYDLYLRFKRTYKPYAIGLIDVQKKDYVGTTTPKDYSSYIRLVDESRATDQEKRIWMNNPLRYAGETFYQSNYGVIGGVEFTDLQIVKNRGWMIPYVACMIVATGMIGHFVITLGRFINRLSSVPSTGKAAAVDEVTPASKPSKPKQGRRSRRGQTSDEPLPAPTAAIQGPPPLVAWGIPVVLVILCLAGVYRQAKAPRISADQLQINEFGRLPVAYQGRVKPYDSLARNSLRVISGLESYEDEWGNRQPAIAWLLDVISGSDEADKHKVFRITSFEVLDTFGLEPRKGYRFSYNELEPQMNEYRRQLSRAIETAQSDKAKLTLHQKKLLDLNEKLQLYFALRSAHIVPEGDHGMESAHAIVVAPETQRMLESQVPLSVHTSSEKTPWLPLTAAASREHIKQLAETNGRPSAAELAKKVADEVKNDKLFEQLVDAGAVQMMREHLRSQFPDMSDSELTEVAHRQLKNMPPNVRETFRTMEAAKVEQNLLHSLVMLNYDELIKEKPNRSARSLTNILNAYRKGDVKQFNNEVAAYEERLEDNPVAEVSVWKTNLETFYNQFSPFFNSWILYLVAFVLTCAGWLALLAGWEKPLNRAAVMIILVAFAIHTAGLLLRILISGRPPVTNLYSSAIFIGWACVGMGLILELICRLGLGRSFGIGNVFASVIGFLTLAVAIFGLSGDGDTITVMQAVLDTQFWLSTHVVCITLGYATTFVAGLAGLAFVLVGVCTPLLGKRLSRDLPAEWTVGRILSLVIYGIICFAIFFSFVGTVLGGLWADDSWGRFWGWDPKENGALIIVVWNALILHARWGAMVKDRGMAVLAIAGNIVTAWSWFGVNQLGIGLHSYGFTEGVLLMLGFFVLSQLLFIGIGLMPKNLWWSYRDQQRDDEIVDAQPA